MNIICIEDEAFYALIEVVFERIELKSQKKDKWISAVQTMRLLNIKSKTTLQKLRDEGKIRFSQPQKKIILYDYQSIDEYLEKNVYKTF